jgi:hypothetical protein
MRVFCFLCDVTTESECLSRLLVGTTITNAEWALEILVGDSICLYNFQTGDIWGPFAAVSGTDCHEPGAWGGRFPLQVRVAKTPESRRSTLATAKGKQFLFRGRPRHVMEEQLASSILSWVKQGKNF